MIAAVAETFSFAGGLLAVPAFLFVIVSFATSPFVVASWAVYAVMGRPHPMLADPSNQARFVVVFHAVTTALVVLALAWAVRAF